MSNNFDTKQAKSFIDFLHGSSSTPQCWQVFHDDKTPNKVDELKQPKTFFANLADCEEYFNDVNSYDYGIYVTLNKTDGQGREEKNIMGFRVLFADFDNMELPEFPIEPHMVTQRDELHSHAYWLVSGIVTGDQFERYQRQLSLYLDSDKQVFDTTRVVRVVGSYNMKNPALPAMYNIVEEAGDKTPYTLPEIEEAFKLEGESLTKLEKSCSAGNALRTGEGFNENPRYRKQMIDWCGRAEPAILGSGSYTLIKVASMGFDLGIPLAECQEIMWEHYDPRCIPTWHETNEQKDFNACVYRAYKGANNAVGCRTGIGKFSAYRAENPLKEPTGGWEANAKLGKKKAKRVVETVAMCDQENFDDDTYEEVAVNNKIISQAQGAMIYASITNKSSVWDMAKAFVGVNYPDGGLVRSDKMFYEFNGRCWDTVKDEDVKSQLAYFYNKGDFTLPPSKIVNIMSYINDLTQKKHLENSSWLVGNKDGKNTLVFDNGILDMSSKVIELKPHTRDFFTLNQMGYSYDPDATCPEFEKFLAKIWDDPNLILKLEEWFGYVLTSDTKFQRMALFMGKSRGGKGVLTTVITNLVGEHNTISPTIESIIENSMKEGMSQAKLTLIPEATDIHPSKRFAVLGGLKAMSGGDGQSWHRMYVGKVSSKTFGKILITTNSMPNFVDTSGALANRFEIFPFIKSFVGKEDLELPKRVAKEKSGILNLAIRGLKRLYAQGGFTKADASIEAVDDMKRDMFPLADFIDDYCVIESDNFIKGTDLYKAYQHYQHMKDNKSVSTIMFGKYLKASYLPINPSRSKDSHRYRGFCGIRLNDAMTKTMGQTDNGGKIIPFKPVPSPKPITEKEQAI